MARAMCIVTADVEEEPTFHGIVLFNEETPERVIKRLRDEGDLELELDVEYFLMDSTVAVALEGIEFPDYVSRDAVGDIGMKRLMLRVCKAFAVEAESVKPMCPECECETIVMTISRNLVYKINGVYLGEYEGTPVLVADDIDQVEADETDVTVYSCTGEYCTFKSKDLTDFSPL